MLNSVQDIANTDIRVWRHNNLKDFVEFEQQEIIRSVFGGWEALRWLPWESHEQKRSEAPTISAFSMAFIDLIALNTIDLPVPFTLDYDRIRALQTDFQILMYQSICRRTFQRLLNLQGWTGFVPQASYDTLFSRLSIIATASGLAHDVLQRPEVIALEIIRETHYLSNKTGLPDQHVLDVTVAMLQEASKPTSPIHEDLEQDLLFRLEDLVEEEMDAIDDFTPVQMANRYASQGSRFTNINEKLSLEIVAGRIAHIAVLHWRVWAPILYQRPCTTRADIATLT